MECFSGVFDPAGCARVAVADSVQAAEKAAQDENSSKMQSLRALVIGVVMHVYIECIDEKGVEGHDEAHMVVHFCTFMGRDHRRFNILPTKAVSEDQGSVLSCFVSEPAVVNGEGCLKGQDLAVRLASVS